LLIADIASRAARAALALAPADWLTVDASAAAVSACVVSPAALAATRPADAPAVVTPFVCSAVYAAICCAADATCSADCTI
jgi:hypothetical protein